MEWLDRAEDLYPQNTKNRQGMDLTIWKALEGLMVREIFLEGTALMNNGGNLANGGDRYSRWKETRSKVPRAGMHECTWGGRGHRYVMEKRQEKGLGSHF